MPYEQNAQPADVGAKTRSAAAFINALPYGGALGFVLYPTFVYLITAESDERHVKFVSGTVTNLFKKYS